jgi:hypothetical protein
MRGPDPLPRRRSSTQPEQRLITDAEAAEVSFAAFRAHRHRFDDQVTGRLIVRRVRWFNPRRKPGRRSCSLAANTTPTLRCRWWQQLFTQACGPPPRVALTTKP